MSNIIKLTSLGTTYKGGGGNPAPSRVSSDQIQIEKDYKTLRRQLKEIKKNGGETDVKELMYLDKLVRQLIPIAASQYAKWQNDKAALSLKILIEQKREIVQDIRALNSGAKHIEHITNRILSPALQALMQNYMSECFELKKQYRKIKDLKLRKSLLKNLDTNMEAFGKHMNAVQDGAEEKLNDYFGNIKKR